jgi:hypothetical protein
MGVSRQENAFPNAKVTVVRGECVHAVLELAPDLPQIRKQAAPNRRTEVFGAG